MRTAKYAVFFFLLSFETAAQATPAHASDAAFGLVDAVTEIMLLRPAGLIGTILGTGFFVATTPLTALANIAPPHDAFEKTIDVFIMTPAKYTFDRPMGVYYRDEYGEYRRPDGARDRPAMSP
ncbi:MAG: hypothetical protein ABFS02_08350 [Pseudomonadota bacterium]